MDWQNWKHLPETKKLLEYLAAEREELKESWAGQAYVTDKWVTQTGKNAEALGRANQLGDIIHKIVDEPESMEGV